MEIIKRLYQVSKAYIGSTVDHFLRDNNSDEFNFFDKTTETDNINSKQKPSDPNLAEYYANLEIPYGSDMEMVKVAWKKLLKKYHPDVHSSDPEKKRIATILTQRLNEAYREIEKAISKE